MQKELFFIVVTKFISGDSKFYSILDNSHGLSPDEELAVIKKQIGSLFSFVEVI